MMWRIWYMSLICLMLAGCLEPSVEGTKPADAQSLVDGMVYVKSKNGLCFGVSTTSRIDSGLKMSYTVQVVHVPCDAVGY